MSTEGRRGKLRRQDTPISTGRKERRKQCAKNSVSKTSQSSASCDEKSQSPPRNLVLKTAFPGVNPMLSSSVSSAPR